MNLVDTHSHLFWDSYKDDFEEVANRAIEAGVKTVINVGVDLNLSIKALNQAKKQSRDDFKIYASIGIHPEEAVRYYNNEAQLEADVLAIEKLYLENKKWVVAVGECGLDFAYFNREGYLPKGLSIEHAEDLQRKLFTSQIDLAKKYGLPLLIHCRDDRSINFQNTECWDGVVQMTQDWKGIYHCYSGLLKTTREILEKTEFLVSFAGNLTYPKNDYLKEAVKILPLERIVLETDCPFLPPQSIRGKRNEPSSVREVAQVIAQLRNEPFEKISDVTSENFNKLFELQ